MTDLAHRQARHEPALASLPPADPGVDAQDTDAHSGHRRSALPWIAALGAVAIAAAALIAWRLQTPPAPAPVAAAPPTPPAAPATTADMPPPIRYPIDAARASAESPAPTGEAPPLDDATLLASLLALPGGAGLDHLLVTDDLARRFVATIDNLPRATVAARVMAVRPADGAFAVDTDDGRATLGRSNTLRYAPYVKTLQALDTKALVALYVRHYDVFQKAYRDLGYPNGYFNDRLVDVIDHLLAAPDAAGPAALVQPRILYEYANPDFEARSAGQKAMLRLGPENEAAAKAKLRELRRALTAAQSHS